ncbi:MAG: Gfo/Idh/MocA family oxidoreductase [Oscillospiraceae bacterium]|nr:Gfo/Idh/MocA family oxidoreductase [Oscillospiraceae bacterium]
MADKTIRFGILGCGAIARFHADAIAMLDNAELIGVAGSSLESAQRFALGYQVKAYADYNEMLADQNVDAVCICTPSGFHAENTMQALHAKKHVVLEKPMTFTKAEAKAIAAEAEKSGCVLTVICQLRFSEDVRRVKKLLADRALGELVFCDLYMKYWRDHAYYASSNWKGTRRFDGGGALMNQGIHGIDLLLYLVGNAKVVHAKNCTRLHDIEVEDASMAMLQFENGAMGVIEASTCVWPGFERRLEINGTRGSVILVENQIQKLIIDGETLVERQQRAGNGTASNPTAFACDLHALQISNFIDAICGRDELLITAAEGGRAVALIEEIYQFGLQGR